MTLKSTVAARPSETTTGVVGVAAAAAIAFFDTNPKVAGSITAGVSLLGATVTYLHTHGGLAGVWSGLVHGNRPGSDT